MTYCTVQDLIDRFGEQELIDLTDEHGTEEIESTQVTRAIIDASGFIESYLSSRYTLPLSEIPPILNKIACDLVHYGLYDSPTDDVNKRFDGATKFLRDVSTGKAGLGINTSGSKPQTNNSATMQHSGSVFSRKDNGFM